MSDDLISRQKVIDVIDKHIGGFDAIDANYLDGLKTAMGLLNDLPPAQSERKKGKWVKLDMHAHLADHKCTACGQECYVPTCMGEPMYIYCPNCGADMRGEQE